MTLHCILCHQIIDPDDPGPSRLDPRELVVTARGGGAPAPGDGQVFYCHDACFRRWLGREAPPSGGQDAAEQPAIAPERSVPPFTSEARDGEGIQNILAGAQPDFAPEDIPLIEALLSDLARNLEWHGERCGVWEKLLAYPRGRWVALASLCNVGDAVYRRIEALDPFMQPREDILVAWVDDYYNHRRPFENNRLVLLALDSSYTWMRQLIIPLERPDRPNPGLIP